MDFYMQCIRVSRTPVVEPPVVDQKHTLNGKATRPQRMATALCNSQLIDFPYEP